MPLTPSTTNTYTYTHIYITAPRDPTPTPPRDLPPRDPHVTAVHRDNTEKFSPPPRHTRPAARPAASSGARRAKNFRFCVAARLTFTYNLTLTRSLSYSLLLSLSLTLTLSFSLCAELGQLVVDDGCDAVVASGLLRCRRNWVDKWALFGVWLVSCALVLSCCFVLPSPRAAYLPRFHESLSPDRFNSISPATFAPVTRLSLPSNTVCYT